MTDHLYSIAEACERLHMSRWTLKRERDAGRIRTTRAGRPRILASEIERVRRLLEPQRVPTFPAPVEGRRRPGSGALWQDKRGRWVGSIYLKDRRRVVRVRPTKELAEQALAEIIEQHRDELGFYAYRLHFQPELVGFPWPRESKAPRAGMSTRRRWLVLERDGHRCRYCGATPEDKQLVVDHIVPVAAGGSDEMDNLATACVDCNAGKADLRLVG